MVARSVVSAYESLGLSTNPSTLSRELAEQFSFRLLFLLLPQECLFGEPRRDTPVIEAHLQALGVVPRPQLVKAIKFFVDNFRAKTRQESAKPGITDVYIRYPKIYESILSSQAGRCAVCGVQLHYGVNMQLDHLLPWHLGDDPSDGSNWQFLCDVCNRGKGLLPHYSLGLVSANWIKPDISHSLAEDIRYASLLRDRRCILSGRGPRETHLIVRKKVQSGCWVLDNTETVDGSLIHR